LDIHFCFTWIQSVPNILFDFQQIKVVCYHHIIYLRVKKFPNGDKIIICFFSFLKLVFHPSLILFFGRFQLQLWRTVQYFCYNNNNQLVHSIILIYCLLFDKSNMKNPRKSKMEKICFYSMKVFFFQVANFTCVWII